MSNQSSKSLNYWLQQIESFHPKEVELGLDRIRIVAQLLKCTEFDCPVISVAGTNGKGSTVECLKQLALVKGLNVGTYTSPHLFEFNERIAINGEAISDERLVEAFEKIEKVRTQNPKEIIPLSFFEFTTLAALFLFKQAKLDLVVLEVGLGGRLDAVNLVNADIAIISSIGIDHAAWLGNSREEISIEKAGIARKDKICIIGDPQPPKNLQDYLNKLSSHVLQINRDFYFEKEKTSIVFFLSHSKNKRFSVSTDQINLAPENIILALQAFATLDWEASTLEAKKALSSTQLLGRFQVFNLAAKGKGRVICDLTHNPAGAQFFLKQLQKYFETFDTSSVTFLFGVMADKDIEGIVNTFYDISDQWLVCDLDSERAAKAEDLMSLINSIPPKQGEKNTKKTVQAFESVAQGLEYYFQHAKPDDCLVVMGSFFTVAPAIKMLSN